MNFQLDDWSDTLYVNNAGSVVLNLFLLFYTIMDSAVCIKNELLVHTFLRIRRVLILLKEESEFLHVFNISGIIMTT